MNNIGKPSNWLARLTRPEVWWVVAGCAIPLYLVLVYVENYALRTPFIDQWFVAFETMLATRNGTLTPEYLLSDTNGHLALFNRVLTIVSANFWDWDLKREAYFNVAVAVGLGLTWLAILRRQHGDKTHFLVLPVMAIVLGINQFEVWVYSGGNATLMSPFLSSLAIAILYLRRVHIGNFIAAALIAWVATLSLGNGLMAWWAILIGLWFWGYRHPAYLASWFVLSLVASIAYQQLAAATFAGETVGDNVAGEIATQLPSPDLWLDYAVFGLTLMGVPFSLNILDPAISTLTGSVGIVLFIANFLALWRTPTKLESKGLWLTFAAYATATALIITIRRYESTLASAVQGRYIIFIAFFWVALLSMAVQLETHTPQHQAPRSKQLTDLLRLANRGAAILLVMLFLHNSIFAAQFMENEFGRIMRPGQDALSQDETCILNAPMLVDSSTCLGQLAWNWRGRPQRVYQMAAHGVSVFAEQDEQNIFDNMLDTTAPIIIDSDSAALNAYLSRVYFAGNTDNLIWIAPDVNAETFPSMPGQAYMTFERDLISSLGDTVWYARSPSAPTDFTDIEGNLSARGYRAIQLAPIRYFGRATAWELWRFETLDDETIYQIGDFALRDWQLSTFTLQPCQTITLESIWQLAENSNPATVLTVALVQPETGAILAANDMPIDFATTSDALAFDNRRLDIPCDALAGTYMLLLGAYEIEPLRDLEIRLGDDSLIDGNRAFLTTLTVED